MLHGAGEMLTCAVLRLVTHVPRIRIRIQRLTHSVCLCSMDVAPKEKLIWSYSYVDIGAYVCVRREHTIPNFVT